MYEIVRFHQDGRQSVQRRGLTLEEAVRHCSDPRTRGAGWFDGFRRER